MASDIETSVSAEEVAVGQLHLVKDSLTDFKFNSHDLMYIDHRLKLYLSMAYFEDDEQPLCTLRVCPTHSVVM